MNLDIVNHPNEYRFILNLCNRYPKSDLSLEESQFYIKNIDWDLFFNLINKHRLIPVVNATLKEHNVGSLMPTKVIDKLLQISSVQTLRNLGLTRELLSLLAMFKEEKVFVLPYKGPVLAKLAFGDISNRQFSDLDLLVSKTNLMKIKDLLETRNYNERFPIPDILKQDNISSKCEAAFDCFDGKVKKVSVDLHWNIGNRMQQLNLSLEDLENMFTKNHLADREVITLNKEGMLIVTCMHHLGKEEYLGLKHICDIHAILYSTTDFNWSLMLHEAERLKVRNLVLVGLGVTKSLFDNQIPDMVLKHLSSALNKEIRVQINTLLSHQSDVLAKSSVMNKMWFHFRVRQHLSTRIKILYYHILHVIRPNKEDIENSNISRIQYLLLYIKKPIRLWKKYV